MPRPGGSAEDDGWVLVMVNNAESQRTDLCIVDAQNIAAGDSRSVTPAVTKQVPYAPLFQGTRRRIRHCGAVCLSRSGVHAAPAAPCAIRPARQLVGLRAPAAAGGDAGALAAQLQHHPALTRICVSQQPSPSWSGACRQAAEQSKPFPKNLL